ncbi:hypothetical protein FisN_8Hh050 [Fistulifera solaris]|uniref:Ribosome assembly protein 3 n=1 Tax=Fistulifera solaris TaxID=1519565 RepID=A0A1Z5JJE3_FISSO|nr:hypothetical protein FisN_8Hh050 [Fistulifera solaris]|eukprot:GAX14114.1 hypothetical protein FisN_8Hh050 [Fistulifera solaris]
MPELTYAEESAAVEEAASEAFQLIDSYAERETNDPNGPWRQPETILSSLNEARAKLMNAWNELSAKMAEDEQNEKATAVVNEEDFRVAYVNMITDAFADILEDLRNNDPDFDVDVLVDCLQSGMELIPEEDRALWMKELQEEETTNDIDELTPHARRRRDLGYDVESATK